jgi:hypothetical protein
MALEFSVVVYHGDYCEEEPDDFSYDRLVHSASHLGSTTVTASDDQEAAAKAWIEFVGKARAEELIEMDAPVEIITDHTDVQAVMAQLRKSAVEPAQYELFNRFEVWYFRVAPLAETNRLKWRSSDVPCQAPHFKMAIQGYSKMTKQGVGILALLTPSRN